MPHPDPPKKVPLPPEEDGAQRPKQPQKQQAVVEEGAIRPPTQSLIDEERGDWEGMGQGAPRPD